jgi:hypothetical protein
MVFRFIDKPVTNMKTLLPTLMPLKRFAFVPSMFVLSGMTNIGATA